MTTSEPPEPPSNGLPPSSAGRAIAAIPLAHLLLLPRSLLILSSSLYTSHLHGISSCVTDTVLPRRTGNAITAAPPREEDLPEGTVRIANAELLGDAQIQDKLRSGSWTADRGLRTSLTFRHADRIVKGGSFALALGGLQRK